MAEVDQSAWFNPIGIFLIGLFMICRHLTNYYLGKRSCAPFWVARVPGLLEPRPIGPWRTRSLRDVNGPSTERPLAVTLSRPNGKSNM